MTPSLRDRRNLTSESNACEAAPGSSFWAPNGLNELPQRAFRISFHLDCRIDNGILTGKHGVYSNPGTQVETQSKEYGAVLQTDLTRV